MNHAFHNACQRGDVDQFHESLTQPMTDDDYLYGVKLAAMHNHGDMVRLIVNQSQGESQLLVALRALTISCLYSYIPIATMLITDFGLVPSHELIRHKYQRLLFCAVRDNNTDVVRLLLHQYPLTDQRFMASDTLDGICYYGDTDMLSMLLDEFHTEPSDSFQRLLEYACIGGNPDIVTRLIAEPRLTEHPLFSVKFYVTVTQLAETGDIPNVSGQKRYAEVLRILKARFVMPELKAIKATAKWLSPLNVANRVHRFLYGPERMAVLPFFEGGDMENVKQVLPRA